MAFKMIHNLAFLIYLKSSHCRGLQSNPVKEIVSAQVDVVDRETAVVHWVVQEQSFRVKLEIVYSPVESSYYIVMPITNPTSTFAMLENLRPFTQYRLIIRTNNYTNNYFQSEALSFSTSVVTLFEENSKLKPVSFENSDLILVLAILIIWGVVVSLFFQRWGKIRSLLPYQPVYSKEMVDKMEKIETEKTLRSNRASFSIFPLDCDCNLRQEQACHGSPKPKHATFNRCSTTSTSFLPTSSLVVDSDQLRKTKSAENVFCPRIVIDKSLSRQVSSSTKSFPMVRSSNYLQNSRSQCLEVPKSCCDKRLKNKT